MHFHEDSSFQGILYKPNIEANYHLDKKFMIKRKEIFQSLNIRKTHKTKPLEESKATVSPLAENYHKSTQKLHLPDISLYSRPKHQQIIPIDDHDKIVKQISKSLNFINKKVPVLSLDFSSIFHETTKSISYESQVYKNELEVMNLIFKDCGIAIKPRDVMILEGQKSKSKYIIFTSNFLSISSGHPKHPQSLCCKSEIVTKHMEFLSAKRLYFAKEKSFDMPLKSLITLCCMQCGDQIIKIRPRENDSSMIDDRLSPFKEQKRLLNYSKLISSGRFKKALINDESVEMMKNRKSPLVRSKTRMNKLQEISQSQKLNNLRYTEYEREIRVKSYQDSMNLNKQVKNNELESLINRRKNNISQIFVRKNQ